MENTPEEIDNTVAKPTNPPIEVGGTGLDTNSQIVETGARRIDDNYPTPTAPTPEDTPVDIGKIPGVKEVYIKPAATPAPNRAPAFVDPKTGKPLDLSMKKFLEDTMKGGMINQWIAKYELQGIDLEKEGALIEKKQSRLSAAKRKVVVALLNMRAQQRRLLADIGKELLKKDNPTDDELRALLDGVEDAHTNQEEATAAVLSNIVQKADRKSVV